MLGIGPMLPVIPAAESVQRFSKKSRKRENHRETNPGSHELEIMSRPSMSLRPPSTIKTGSTLVDIESSDECSSNAIHEPAILAHHQRDLSLIIDFDLEHATIQLNNGEISDLELALFAFWIKANPDNYATAKAQVRELGLDQGYNIDKITNQRVRKLLQEVHDIRPRDPRHASTWKSSFHNQTHNPAMRINDGIRAVSSSLTARMDCLPPSLRLKRDLAVQEAARPTMSTTDTAAYPPNTPDRPAPLSVKSRSSQISNSTPIPRTVFRSVSTPVRAQTKDGLMLLTDPAFEKVENLTSQAQFANASFSGCTADIFDDMGGMLPGRANDFTARLSSNSDKRHGATGRHMKKEYEGQAPANRYQLDASDAASDSSYSISSSILRTDRYHSEAEKSHDRGFIADDTFDALESYVGSEDEDDHSLLESASAGSEEDCQIQYRFASTAPIMQPIIARPVPTLSERRAQRLGLSAAAVNFHRPLPLRHHESEAILFPTAGAQAYSGRNRSKSVTSIVHSTRHTTSIIHCTTLPISNQADCSSNQVEQESSESANSHIKVSQRCSNESTLSAFPIPPMKNPVGELPILVSRAATSLPTPAQISFRDETVNSSLEGMYCAITKVNMTALLQRTRARGGQLRIINWEALTSFERAWRDVNESLLTIIYGRKDVHLDESDVAYIDCVTKELHNISSDTDPMAWVRRIFEQSN